MEENEQLLFVCRAGNEINLKACQTCEHHWTNIGDNCREPYYNEPDIWLSGMGITDCMDYIPIDEAENG